MAPSTASPALRKSPSTVKDKPAEQSYKVLINVTLNLKDARTDEAVDSHIFSMTDSDISWMTTADKALNDAIDRLASRISEYYNHRYPFMAVSWNVVKKEGQTTHGVH